jgi:hypothetical protein
MGVRFQCPAGHKLHVKAELAGKRGICPECGAKFVVPSFSGGRVAEDNGDAPSVAAAVSAPPPVVRAAAAMAPASTATTSAQEPAESIIISTQAPAAPPVSQTAAALVAATSSSSPAASITPPIAWYVRPASGGQFGPATVDVFREWIADGRVAADSWVWRTGWADWKAGGEALALIAAEPAADPVQALGAAIEQRAGVLPGVTISPTAPGSTAPHVEPGTAELRRLEIKRRKQRVRTISTVLALVALAMLMALVVVLAR